MATAPAKTVTADAAPSDKEIWTDEETAQFEQKIAQWDTNQINNRTRMLETNIRIMKSETQKLQHDQKTLQDRVKENLEKVKMNKQLPYLVSTVVEILDVQDEGQDDGSSVDQLNKTGKAVVIKTSTRQTVFLPVVGLVDVKELKPSDLVGVNKDSYLILDKLPAEYDSRVKAFEVDEKPTEDYSDIGGLDKQIQELIEAVVRPLTHKHLFEKIGIKPPKGVLMYGPPGVGKTLMARACAAKTNACFLKLAATQLVQMFIGDGAKLVRDAFALAREKAPAIIFIDELDAIGTKRFDSSKSGDREVQRTMLELLSQMDGFTEQENVKVIAATNRPDVLDPALLRSGRFDRKIEFPLPDEDGRAKILAIHSNKMNVNLAEVNFTELARCCEDFNGAQLKAVCVEAGMIALRRDAAQLTHEDFMEGISEVMAKKKANLEYYA